jgi:hypothetical protein
VWIRDKECGWHVSPEVIVGGLRNCSISDEVDGMMEAEKEVASVGIEHH